MAETKTKSKSPEAKYIIVSYSMSEVFKIVSASAKAKAKLDGQDVTTANARTLFLTETPDGILISSILTDGKVLHAVFKE